MLRRLRRVLSVAESADTRYELWLVNDLDIVWHVYSTTYDCSLYRLTFWWSINFARISFSSICQRICTWVLRVSNFDCFPLHTERCRLSRCMTWWVLYWHPHTHHLLLTYWMTWICQGQLNCPHIQAPRFPPPCPRNNTVQNDPMPMAIPLFVGTGTNTCLSHCSQSPESRLWERRCSQHQ